MKVCYNSDLRSAENLMFLDKCPAQISILMISWCMQIGTWTCDVGEQETKDDGARYAFAVRWLDPMTQIEWKYQFFYHTSDRSIEMVRLIFSFLLYRRHHRTFAKCVFTFQLHIFHLKVRQLLMLMAFSAIWSCIFTISIAVNWGQNIYPFWCVRTFENRKGLNNSKI